MITFVFAKNAEKGLKKLPADVKERISNKLKELKSHNDIFSILRGLSNFEPATHRLRIGDYRLILQLIEQDECNLEFLVLDIGHRKDIYG